MKIKDYKCKCGHNDFFFVDKGNQKGIYCTYCGKWFKWADTDERNLAMKQESITKNEGVGYILKAEVDKIIDCPYFRLEDKLIKIMNLPSVYPKSDKPSGKCKDCGHYEKCTNLCSKNYLDKVFREPNWFCADFEMMEN